MGTVSDEIWINPTGGLGDALMLSGVLKQCIEKDPAIRYNLVRRSIYRTIFAGHPAITRTGYPGDGARIITTHYWAAEQLGSGNQRAYQVLARMFGLSTPIEERLFLPGEIPEDPFLYGLLPDHGRKIVAIAPVSVSPRKMIPLYKWVDLVRKLQENDYFVVQLGDHRDYYIPGTCSLLGQTTPQQLVGFLKRCSVLISIDNFIMHAAHLSGTPALIVWGPTSSEVYGYAGHMHLQTPASECPMVDRCLGTHTPENYTKLCPLESEHCMNQVTADTLYRMTLELTGKENRRY